MPLDWDTPLGKIAVAGTGSDTHSGTYLLLIDLGGNDRYEDVGRPLGARGVSLVLDLAGNDTVRWQTRLAAARVSTVLSNASRHGYGVTWRLPATCTNNTNVDFRVTWWP